MTYYNDCGMSAAESALGLFTVGMDNGQCWDTLFVHKFCDPVCTEILEFLILQIYILKYCL
jgi:hypothetical protein